VAPTLLLAPKTRSYTPDDPGSGLQLRPPAGALKGTPGGRWPGCPQGGVGSELHRAAVISAFRPRDERRPAAARSWQDARASARTASVSVAAASGLMTSVAMTVRLYTRPVPGAAMPPRMPVAGSNVMPPGSFPERASLGAGEPLAATVNVVSMPAVAVSVVV